MYNGLNFHENITFRIALRVFIVSLRVSRRVKHKKEKHTHHRDVVVGDQRNEDKLLMKLTSLYNY